MIEYFSAMLDNLAGTRNYNHLPDEFGRFAWNLIIYEQLVFKNQYILYTYI